MSTKSPAPIEHFLTQFTPRLSSIHSSDNDRGELESAVRGEPISDVAAVSLYHKFRENASSWNGNTAPLDIRESLQDEVKECLQDMGLSSEDETLVRKGVNSVFTQVESGVVERFLDQFAANWVPLDDSEEDTLKSTMSGKMVSLDAAKKVTGRYIQATTISNNGFTPEPHDVRNDTQYRVRTCIDRLNLYPEHKRLLHDKWGKSVKTMQEVFRPTASSQSPPSTQDGTALSTPTGSGGYPSIEVIPPSPDNYLPYSSLMSGATSNQVFPSQYSTAVIDPAYGTGGYVHPLAGLPSTGYSAPEPFSFPRSGGLSAGVQNPFEFPPNGDPQELQPMMDWQSHL